MGRNAWHWDASRFENIDQPNVSAKADFRSWSVTLKAKDLAWGHCITLPEDTKTHILWRAKLKVLNTEGDISPGIAFHDFHDGILLQINSARKTAELRRMKVNQETIVAAMFNVADFYHPYDLILEYNVLTCGCSGFIGWDRVFDIKLPGNGIPPLSSVEAIEIVTTSPKNELNGRIVYGGLNLSTE